LAQSKIPPKFISPTIILFGEHGCTVGFHSVLALIGKQVFLASLRMDCNEIKYTLYRWSRLETISLTRPIWTIITTY
jgi:hypothetical protein